jgi:hypothetical protein
MVPGRPELALPSQAAENHKGGDGDDQKRDRQPALHIGRYMRRVWLPRRRLRRDEFADGGKLSRRFASVRGSRLGLRFNWIVAERMRHPGRVNRRPGER